MLKKFVFYIYLISTNRLIAGITTTERRGLSKEASEGNLRNDLSHKIDDNQIFRKEHSDSASLSFSSSSQDNRKINAFDSTAARGKSKLNKSTEWTNNLETHSTPINRNLKREEEKGKRKDEQLQLTYYDPESNTEKTYQGVTDFLMPKNDGFPAPRLPTESHSKFNQNSSKKDEHDFSTHIKVNSTKSNEQSFRLISSDRSASNPKPKSSAINHPPSTGSSTFKGHPKNEARKKQRLCEQKYMEYMTRIFNDDDTVADGSDSEYDGRILAEPGEYPHMTALGFLAPGQVVDYKCGGSLISENFVLTAAHCTNLTGEKPNKVRIGDLNLMIEERYLEPQIRNISRIFTHPDYRFHLYYNDIALLELEEPVEFTEFVRPIRLWVDKPLPVNATAHAMGYGATAFGKARTNRLTDMNLTIVPNDSCNRDMPEMPEAPMGIISTQICARDYLMNRDTCQGDSGGPLQINLRGRRRRDRKHYHLIGITSYGLFCRSSYPSVYTRVSEFLDWIEQIVWPARP